MFAAFLRPPLQALPRAWRVRARLHTRKALRRLPRRLAPAVLGAALLGAGAYAVASVVATLGPDPAQLPVRQVSQPVQALMAAPAPDQPFNLYRTDYSRTEDTPQTLLMRLGLNDPQAAAFMQSHRLIHAELLGRTGRLLTLEADAHQHLRKFVARWSRTDDGTFQRLTVERVNEKQGDGAFTARLETAPLTASLRMASGVIQSSLFESTDEAGIPDAVAGQLAELFSGDIDFYSGLRKGDRYAVVYEMLEGDGEPLRAGRVLSAEFINAGKAHQAVWFTEPDANRSAVIAPGQPTQSTGKSGYYDLEGRSLKRAYLAAPLAFSRISSGFRMRFHPIFKQWKAHTGVDYAAPTGTPVRCVGDGVVESAGVSGGYGNAVFVRHNNGRDVTVYGHLSRIFVRKGQRIAQGQTLGAVGMTGWATGPHLHFEFRINGKYENPLLVVRNSDPAPPVSSQGRAAFGALAAQARQHLAAAQLLASR